MAVSPDGRYLAFTANTGDNKPDQLWVRRLDSLEAKPITNVTTLGGEAVQQPFWSPDSRTIGYFLDGKIRTVGLEGGLNQVVCDAPGQNFGASWGADGTILFGTSATGGLRRVAATGGVPSQVTTLDKAAGETQHLWPKWLPGGRRFLYQSHGRRRERGRTSHLRRLPRRPGSGQGSRISLHGGVRGARLALVRPGWRAGGPASGARHVPTDRGSGGAVRGRAGCHGATVVSASAYRERACWCSARVLAAAEATRSWRGWTGPGRELATVGQPASIRGLELSPDGRRAALHVDESNGRGDVWVLDLERDTMSRLTFDPQNHNRGSRLGQGWQARHLRQAEPRSASTKRTPAVSGKNGWSTGPKAPSTGSFPSGCLRMARRSSSASRRTTAESPRFRLREASLPCSLAVPRWKGHAQLSPDGKWLAYQSDEGGRPQVFIRSFPEWPDEVPGVDYRRAPSPLAR